MLVLPPTPVRRIDLTQNVIKHLVSTPMVGTMLIRTKGGFKTLKECHIDNLSGQLICMLGL